MKTEDLLAARGAETKKLLTTGDLLQGVLGWSLAARGDDVAHFFIVFGTGRAVKTILTCV